LTFPLFDPGILNLIQEERVRRKKGRKEEESVDR